MSEIAKAIEEIGKEMGHSQEEIVQRYGLASYLMARMAGIDKRRLAAPTFRDAQGNLVDVEAVIDRLIAEGELRGGAFDKANESNSGPKGA